MGLPVITPMLTSFDLKNIKVLHVEPTTVCNAACPQCAREQPMLYQDDQHRADLSLEQVKQLVPLDLAKSLEKMFMCGNFGDPAAGKHSIEIYQWFRRQNPGIVFGMNTNGGLKNVSWWKELAQLFSNPQDYVVFSIDGLADTNHIYRRNVVWDRVIANAKSFIDNGGSAHWDMLIFDHNEHQINAARDLAQSLGFRWFRAKVSKRFDWFPVDWLQPPRHWSRPNVAQAESITCHALREKSLYITATGKIMPCCFFGAGIFVEDARRDALLATENFQGVIDSWDHDPHPNCVRHCGSVSQSSNFDRQWQMEVEL